MKAIQILVADDDLIVRETTKQVSERLGYAIIGEAANGLDAVKLSYALKPDVILMDTDMPYLDGLEATRYCLAPVVILTSGDLAEMAGFIFRSGASACLAKPITAIALERAVAIAVAR
jgi:response regulator NasT